MVVKRPSFEVVKDVYSAMMNVTVRVMEEGEGASSSASANDNDDTTAKPDQSAASVPPPPTTEQVRMDGIKI